MSDWVNTTPTQSLLPQTSKSTFDWTNPSIDLTTGSTFSTNDLLYDPTKSIATSLYFNPQINMDDEIAKIVDNYTANTTSDLSGTVFANNNGAVNPNDASLFGGLTDYLGKQKLSDITGLAGLGFSIYDSLWGTGADLKQAQIDLLNQQVAHNKDAMEDKNTFQANVASGANAGTAAGLAAASQTKQG